MIEFSLNPYRVLTQYRGKIGDDYFIIAIDTFETRTDTMIFGEDRDLLLSEKDEILKNFKHAKSQKYENKE